MTEFQLDTSGRVRKGVITPRGDFSFRPGFTRWADLSPFVQGCVKRLLRDLYKAPQTIDGGQTWTWVLTTATREDWLDGVDFDPALMPDFVPVYYSDLAPETLARIIEDCAKFVHKFGEDLNTRANGARLWNDRQTSRPTGFGPLTPYLSDDGKVHLK